jgi:enamine deaminase RidA (YjgF/YER057c/UK114 family)
MLKNYSEFMKVIPAKFDDLLRMQLYLASFEKFMDAVSENKISRIMRDKCDRIFFKA